MILTMKLSHFLLAASSLFSGYSFADSISLPIWKEEAEALGYELPKAIGFNLSYMGMQQGINVDSIALNGLKMDWLDLDLDAQPGKQITNVLTARADVWLFPFLNIYALIGKLDGFSETDVNANIGIKRKNGKVIPILERKIENFRLDLDGYTTGVGFVLAGGYDQWFGLVDASYTQSTLTVIDGSINAIVISPRVGFDFNKNGIPVRIWAGAMYQNVEQELSGSLVDLGLPPILANLAPNGEFEVKQHLATNWNPIAGFQYQVNPSWYLLGEVGFGERQSFFISLDRRF